MDEGVIIILDIYLHLPDRSQNLVRWHGRGPPPPGTRRPRSRRSPTTCKSEAGFYNQEIKKGIFRQHLFSFLYKRSIIKSMLKDLTGPD